jgi:hypothetical protein
MDLKRLLFLLLLAPSFLAAQGLAEPDRLYRHSMDVYGDVRVRSNDPDSGDVLETIDTLGTLTYRKPFRLDSMRIRPSDTSLLLYYSFSGIADSLSADFGAYITGGGVDSTPTPPVAPPVDFVPTANLVLFFDPGDTASYPGSGDTLYDLTANGNHGYIEGGIDTVADGSNVVSLTTSQVIEVAYDSLLHPQDGMTAIMFVNSPFAEGNVGGAGTLGSSPNRGWAMGSNSADAIRFYTSESGTDLVATSGLTEDISDRWVMFVGRHYPGDSMSVTINSQWVGSATSGIPVTNHDNGRALLIGDRGDRAGEQGGSYGPFLLYDRAIRDSEVDSIYNQYQARYGLASLQTHSPDTTLADTAWLITLTGQSNADGRVGSASLPLSLADTISPNAYIWSGGQWVTLTLANAYGLDWGPELAIAKALTDSMPTRVYYFVKQAQGSTSLAERAARSDWSPASSGEMYDQWVAQYDTAIASIPIDYIYRANVWIQGEADATDSAEANAYQVNLENLIDTWDTETGLSTDWVICQTNDNINASFYDAKAIVRAAQAAVASARASVSIFDPTGFGLLNDNLHYNASGNISIGLQVQSILQE